MKISVNLATKPFVELRPLFARLRIVMAALVVLAAALGFTLHALSTKADDAQQKMDALKNRTQQLMNEKARDESRMRQPQNAAVLDRSRFLNDLFARKSFSWTAVMMDLEDVLPAGVQVTSIEPSIAQDGSVHIRLKVSGDRDRAVLLVRNLERSKRFLAPRLSDESMQALGSQGRQRAAEAPGAVEFDILAGYNPLPASRKGEEETKSDTAAAKKPAAKAAAKPAGSTVGAAHPAAGKKAAVPATKNAVAGTKAVAQGGTR